MTLLRTGRLGNRIIGAGALLVLAVFWSIPIAAGVFVNAPFGIKEPSALVTQLLGDASARYFGFSPMPLTMYFFAAMLMRHPVALLLGAQARATSGLSTGFDSLGRIWIRGTIVWLFLSTGGVFAVAALTAPDARSFGWAVEVAKTTALAGLPCLTAAITCGLFLKKAWTFWLVTPLLLLLCAIVAIGLGGDRIPPIFPGLIEGALTAAREPSRSRAVFGALAWPVLGWLLAVAFARRAELQVRAEAA
jgi:hypothetical protein